MGSTPEVYVDYYDITYVIDSETYDLVYSESTDTIAKRPMMDLVVGDYGYVLKDNGDYYVYDLTKWIEVTYIYKVESRYENVKYFVLQNGNVLMTASVRLPGGSVSFDYLDNGDKYDLVYVMIDVAAKTSTPVEFGYVVETVAPAEEGFTAAAAKLNVFTVAPVVDGYVDDNAEMTLLVDNDLKIVCQVEDLGVLVADGLFVREINFFNGFTGYELVDATGKHIRYLNGYDQSGHIIVGNKFYSYNYELLVDMDDYYSRKAFGNYYVLVKEIEVPGETEDDPVTYEYESYIYIPGKAPQKAPVNEDETKLNWTIEYKSGYYMVTYTVEEEVEGELVEVEVVELYSPNGSMFFTVEDEKIVQVSISEELSIVLTRNAKGEQIYNIIQ
jgi:hypothetical protein